MVTIEQKLTLFSKLLNQDIKEESSKKLEALESEYDKRIAENKMSVDKEAKDIVEQARKRAELKRVELISKGKMESKKEFMLIKEELIHRFMISFEEKVKAFTANDTYKFYLQKVIKSLTGLKNYENDLVIYLTQYDLQNNKVFIKDELIKLGISESQMSFEEAQEDILGGLVIKDPILNMRVDESIRSVIDEAKDQIVEKISIAIGEAGDGEHE